MDLQYCASLRLPTGVRMHCLPISLLWPHLYKNFTKNTYPSLYNDLPSELDVETTVHQA